MTINIDSDFNDVLDFAVFASSACFSSRKDYYSALFDKKICILGCLAYTAYQGLENQPNSFRDLASQGINIALGCLRVTTAMCLGLSVQQIVTSTQSLSVADAGYVAAVSIIANRLIAFAQSKANAYFQTNQA